MQLTALPPPATSPYVATASDAESGAVVVVLDVAAATALLCLVEGLDLDRLATAYSDPAEAHAEQYVASQLVGQLSRVLPHATA